MASNGKPDKALDVYVRVSKVGGRNGDSFISPAVQEERCRALATARGYRVGRVWTDLDVSGGTMDRPAFNKALARIRSGTSGGIIVARMDRFARTLRGALATLEEIEAAGGVMVECDGDWDTSTPMGRFGRDLVLRLAQLYREQVADGWATATARMVERGVHGGGRIPAGYSRGEDGRLVPDASAAGVLAAFECRAAGGSWTEVAATLTAAGVPNRGSRKGAAVAGRPWAWTAATKLLANPVYTGQARYGALVHEDAHPAIVSRVLWERVQARRGERPVSRGGDGALLARVARCGSCGRALVRSARSSGGRDYPVYRCRGAGCTDRVTIAAAVLEPLVEASALEYLGAMTYDVDEAGPGAASALEDAEAEVAAFVKHVPATTPGFAEGLATRTAAVEATRGALVDLASPRSRVFMSATETVRVYREMDVPARRDVLRACVTAARVAPGRGSAAERITVELAPAHPLAELPEPESTPIPVGVEQKAA